MKWYAPIVWAFTLAVLVLFLGIVGVIASEVMHELTGWKPVSGYSPNRFEIMEWVSYCAVGLVVAAPVWLLLRAIRLARSRRA